MKLKKQDLTDRLEKKNTAGYMQETGIFIKRLRRIIPLTEEEAETYCIIVRSTYRRIENGENVQLSSFAQVFITYMGMMDEHLVHFIIRKFAEFCWRCREHSRHRLQGNGPRQQPGHRKKNRQ